MKIAATFRWLARGLSIVLAGLLFVFMVGEGPPPLFDLSVVSLESWLLLLAVLGCLAAWRYELAGAIISLLAIAGFYLTDFAASGHFPRGWIFPALALIPLMYLLAWWRR